MLTYTCPGSGHSFPPIGTALALRARGHEVAVRTASSSVDALNRLGLDAAPVDPRIEAIPLEDWKARTSIGALVAACKTLAAPLLIQFSAEPFEYPREWPSNVRPRRSGPLGAAGPEPEWLAGEERPIVLVTISTEFQDDAELIRCALEAFAGRPYAVIATCAGNDPDDFRVPANARVERFLPHGPILRRAAVVVSHGGMGTTQKALAAGVPVCTVPFMCDQFEVARRAEHCGGGTILRPKRLRPDRLRAAAEAAIACRPGAERVCDAFARAGGAEAAASALEGLVAERQKIVA